MNKSRNENKTVLFDFDGTLADTFWLTHSILNDLAGLYSFRRTERDEALALRNLPASRVLEELGIPWYRVPRILREGRKRLHSRIEEIPLSEEYHTLLTEMSRIFRLGVLTTNSRENVELFFRRHGIAFFDFVHSTGRIQGKAGALRKVMRTYGIHRDHCLYVGDEIRDCIAARKAGIRSLSVVWGYNSKSSLEEWSSSPPVETLSGLKERLLSFADNSTDFP